MTHGVLLFAFNNSNIDYVKQAIYCAKRVKKHLGLQVQLVTDAIDYIEQTYPFYQKYIDHITYQETPKSARKKFYDGIYSNKTLEWKNSARDTAYHLSIFDKTLVIDTDLIICNNKLLECFTSNQQFMIAKKYNLVNTNKVEPSFDKISDKSIPMFWATILYFEKSKQSKLIFDLVCHIKENYNYYRLVYDIVEKKFRNDFAFSIAIHIINNFQNNKSWPLAIPTDMWVSTDKDILVDIQNDKIKLLAHKEYDYIVVKLQDATTHIMNKFSLNKYIDEEFKNE
tara:strand:+ start:38173 stop:39021 length:849 start_codon:yes stop_codon:yes gene_type:complete